MTPALGPLRVLPTGGTWRPGQAPGENNEQVGDGRDPTPGGRLWLWLPGKGSASWTDDFMTGARPAIDT